jgi:phosphoglycolate phosphatase-like HAD superfamily hydrolase
VERLVLFDIDGTILSTGGAGKWALIDAIQTVFGREVPHEGYRMGGKTDPLICVELCAAAGFPASEIEPRLPEVWSAYLAGLRRRLTDGFEARVFPGVREAVDRLRADPRVLLGLLTGNIREGAALKLRAVRMDGLFRTGAFGDDHAERSRLADIAVDRGGKEASRTFRGKEVVVIGDTPSDIRCGRHLGVRALAVATGTYTTDQLRDHDPDFLFATLEDTDRLIEAIFSPA